MPFQRKNINEETFTNLNIESAFLLGYIFTDGFLKLDDKTGVDYLNIYSKYKYKIENVKKILLAEYNIQRIKEKVTNGIRQGELFFIRIPNPIIIEDLLDYGMVERKNEKIKFPYMTAELYPHFIRGAWSGSGSVSLYKKSIVSQFTIGSIDFITELEKHLNKIGLTKRTIHENKNSKKPSYLIRYSINDTKKLYDYLYQDSTELTTDLKQKKLLNEYYSNRQTNIPIRIPKRKMKRKKHKNNYC